MAVAALDTLSLTKRLRAAGFSEGQAEAVTDVVREASQLDVSTLVTKADLKAELSDTKTDILKRVFGIVGVQTVVLLGALLTLVRLTVRP